MFYYMYKITNKVNGKFYIGIHKTSDLDDGYMGSGVILKKAIKKYGIENFEKTILEYFDSAELMYEKEKQIVDQEFLQREDVYNVMRGGHGGFDYLISSGKHYNGGPQSLEAREKISNSLKEYSISSDGLKRYASHSNEMTRSNPMFSIEAKEKVSNALKQHMKTEDHKNAISKSLLGKSKKYPSSRKSRVVEFNDVECPHCQKVGKSNIMKRWHFGNCKSFTSVV